MIKIFTKYIFTLVALLCITTNAWGQRWKWTVNVGVASGKGTAKAEIIKHSLVPKTHIVDLKLLICKMI